MRSKHEEEKGLLGKSVSQQVLQRHQPNVILLKTILASEGFFHAGDTGAWLNFTQREVILNITLLFFPA